MKCACLPQKTELVYIIPAIRRGLSVLLSKDLSGNEIASKLGLTKSAISQYLHKKRASEIAFPAEMKKEIEKSAKSISSGKSDGRKETVRLLEVAKKTGCTCRICKRCSK